MRDTNKEISITFTKQEWDYIRKGLLRLALDYSKESDKHKHERNYGLADEALEKAEAVDCLRHIVVNKIFD